MKTKALMIPLVPAALLAASCATAPRRPALTDGRIIGTWQSNRELTVRTLEFPQTIDPVSVRKIHGMFGRLTVTYDGTLMKARLPSNGTAPPFTYDTPYVIEAQDAAGVTLRAVDSLDGKSKSTRVTFEGRDRFWIPLHPIHGREYFDRIE